MLNYISAEWYKLCRTKGLFIAFGILLVLVTLLFFPSFWYQMPTFGVYATAYLAFLPAGFFLAPIFAVKAFDDQYGRGTLKNEVVFGVPRYRSYLGKLSIGALTGTGAALIVLAVYLLLSYMGRGPQEEYLLIFVEMSLRGTLLTLPLWLASMSLAFCLQVVLSNSAGAIAVDYLLLLIGTPLSLIGYEGKVYSPILNFFDRWFFVAPFREVFIEQGLPSWSSVGYSWLIGLGWIGATCLVGITAFRQKEIK